jgi:hypothetical protein
MVNLSLAQQARLLGVWTEREARALRYAQRLIAIASANGPSTRRASRSGL